MHDITVLRAVGTVSTAVNVGNRSTLNQTLGKLPTVSSPNPLGTWLNTSKHLGLIFFQFLALCNNENTTQCQPMPMPEMPSSIGSFPK